jgi:hypothetical protein
LKYAVETNARLDQNFRARQATEHDHAERQATDQQAAGRSEWGLMISGRESAGARVPLDGSS